MWILSLTLKERVKLELSNVDFALDTLAVTTKFKIQGNDMSELEAIIMTANIYIVLFFQTVLNLLGDK